MTVTGHMCMSQKGCVDEPEVFTLNIQANQSRPGKKNAFRLAVISLMDEDIPPIIINPTSGLFLVSPKACAERGDL